MACSRPSASIRAGSSVPGSRRIAEELSAIRSVASPLRASGNLAGLESLYRNALDHARLQHKIPVEILALTTLGNIRVLQYRYSEAISFYLEARNLAQATGDD